jgi:hypothetical protein
MVFELKGVSTTGYDPVDTVESLIMVVANVVAVDT